MAQSDLENEDVFTKHPAPRSDWEAFKWMFFEPRLLEEFSLGLSKTGCLIRFLRIYLKFLVPLIVLIWIILITISVSIDAPIKYPELFRFDSTLWPSINRFIEKWTFMATHMSSDLGLGLSFGLVLGLSFGIAFSLAVGLALGLAFGLAFGFTLGLAFGLAFSMTLGLFFGLMLGLSLGLALGLTFNLNIGLFLGLASGLAGSLALEMPWGLPFGFAFGTAFYIGQYRLIFYPIYYLSFFKKYSLKNNPYLYDEGIWLPLPWIKRALLKESKENVESGLQFARFLLIYRPLQYNLAFEIEHIAVSAQWQNFLRLESTYFNSFPNYFKEKLVSSKDRKMWIPSSIWREQILKIRDTLLQSESQTAIVLKKQYLERCAVLLQEAFGIQSEETFKFHEIYFPVLEHWQKILDNQIREVTQEVERIPSVSLNPYSKGVALAPAGITGSSLFMEREDLKSELSLKIQTAAVMPTFLLLGQRRTGKTSLLNFLPQMLDKSRYAVAVIDAQSMSGELSISVWFSAWRDRVRVIFGLPPDPEPLPKDWLEAWDAFSAFLLELARTNSRKIILCMEEYDESQGFHNALRQDTERGAALLARIRAFSQRQNEVILMFVGATDFIDLPGEPRWSKYFVQIHIFRVEYLSQAGSLKLITEPVPGFRLQYAEGLPERIWELTQGHPHLLHSICSDLVDYANAAPKNPVDHADLDKILAEKTLQRGEQPFVGFWDEFCQNQSMRDVVLEITRHRPVDRALPDVRRLLDYKYVVEDAEGTLCMRVPLFEQWLVRFGY